MKTIKLSVTHRGRLLKKYGQDGLAKIEKALASWIQRDAARGITIAHIALDEAEALKPYGVDPVAGRVTPQKVKAVIDGLFKKLSPDYLVLFGSGDVLPYFEVPNPSYDPIHGDSDETVPTDNPYACSRPFVGSKRESYLVPDRVAGRIPDIPGQKDPAWFTDYLTAAESWKLAVDKDYVNDLLVCCEAWKESGNTCTEFLLRTRKRLLISPPVEDATEGLRRRHGARLHMIKCHGAPLDSSFYGQKGDSYPVALTGASLKGRVMRGTVVGAMCCYGAALFDPDDPAAIVPGSPPIPNVYLRQGAYGFGGSTTIAWVGDTAMVCADWIVASFLRAALRGASLGRAMLDAKLDLVRWINQQGRSPDIAEEKTLLQFHLLGDSSIHILPEVMPGPMMAAGPGTAHAAVASPLGAPEERRARRAFRYQLGEQLREGLPQRVLAKPSKKMTQDLAPFLRRCAQQVDHGRDFVFAPDQPLVHEVRRPMVQPELESRRTRVAAVAAGVARVSASVVRRESFEYYWTARKERGPVPDIRMVKVETDSQGTVLRTELLTSC